MSKIGIFLLAHRRPWLLELIAEQIKETWPDHHIFLTLDRPTREVEEVVSRMLDRSGSGAGALICKCADAPFPVVTFRGERFPELRRWQLDQVRDWGCEYWAIWDDDGVLESPQEVRDYLEAGADMVYARKAFFWDSLDKVNTAIPEHNSVLFFRLREGDQFPLDRIIHAPVGVHDDPKAKIVQVEGRILDVGYLLASERVRVFQAYKRAGKIDPVTMALLGRPNLVPFVGGGKWFRLLKEVM